MPMSMAGEISTLYVFCHKPFGSLECAYLHALGQFFTLVAAMANVGSAKAGSYGGVFVGRLFNGVGSSVPLGIGAATL